VLVDTNSPMPEPGNLPATGGGSGIRWVVWSAILILMGSVLTLTQRQHSI